MLRPVTIRCRVIFDGEITTKDIDAVVGSLRINNSPGWDRLSAEFYKEFSNIISPNAQKALPSIISEVQTGFQAGKSTSDNLILMCLNQKSGVFSE